MDDLNQNPKLGSADRPNSYIGRSVPRERAKKLLEGKGKYVDDILLPVSYTHLTLPTILRV